jgi:SMC interacting uncharacterized protein involved in chromosome segregation
MRTIDGIRYISAREYAEMMNLTVGRVSQIKSELPFVKFDEFGIEVINFDLLELQLKEKAFAQAKFETSNPIHSYSYKDLGNFFAQFALDLVQLKGNADIRIQELQNKNQELSHEITKHTHEASSLKQTIQDLQNEVKLRTEDFNTQNQLSQKLNTELQLKEVEIAELKSKHEIRILELQAQIKNQLDLRSEFDEFKQLIIGELKNSKKTKSA